MKNKLKIVLPKSVSDDSETSEIESLEGYASKKNGTLSELHYLIHNCKFSCNLLCS